MHFLPTCGLNAVAAGAEPGAYALLMAPTVSIADFADGQFVDVHSVLSIAPQRVVYVRTVRHGAALRKRGDYMTVLG